MQAAIAEATRAGSVSEVPVRDGDDGFHIGKGAGFGVHWGNSFIIAGDFGHERDAGWPTYLRLGHLF